MHHQLENRICIHCPLRQVLSHIHTKFKKKIKNIWWRLHVLENFRKSHAILSHKCSYSQNLGFLIHPSGFLLGMHFLLQIVRPYETKSRDEQNVHVS